jgi:hypothetical protein
MFCRDSQGGAKNHYKNLPRQNKRRDAPTTHALSYRCTAPRCTARNEKKRNGAAVFRSRAAAARQPPNSRPPPRAGGHRRCGCPRQWCGGPRVAGIGSGLAGARDLAAPRRRPRRRDCQVCLPVPPLRAPHPRGGPYVWSVTIR